MFGLGLSYSLLLQNLWRLYMRALTDKREIAGEYIW